MNADYILFSLSKHNQRMSDWCSSVGRSSLLRDIWLDLRKGKKYSNNSAWIISEQHNHKFVESNRDQLLWRD